MLYQKTFIYVIVYSNKTPPRFLIAAFEFSKLKLMRPLLR